MARKSLPASSRNPLQSLADAERDLSGVCGKVADGGRGLTRGLTDDEAWLLRAPAPAWQAALTHFAVLFPERFVPEA